MLLDLIISLIIIAIAYVIVARKDHSVLNWLTPSFVLGVPAHFLFPYLYTLFFHSDASLYSQIYCSACYVVAIVIPVAVYRWIKWPAVGWSGNNRSIRWSHWVVLALSELVFLPILIEFRSQLLNPRLIYQETRSGYGITFFGSATLLNVAVVLFFFRRKKNIYLDVIFWAIVIASSLEHGSKGELMSFVGLWLLFRVYVERRPFGIGSAVKFVTIMSLAVISIFIMFGNADLVDLIGGISQYADYTRNAAFVIDDPSRPTYFGVIEVENEVYSRVPRAIFPSKPVIYGSARVIHRYLPDAASENYGPDFGVGIAYSDFGPLAILYIAGFAIINGAGCSMVIRKLKTDPNPGNLILLAFFAGITFIPIGGGYLLPEHLFLSAVGLFVCRIPRVRLLG